MLTVAVRMMQDDGSLVTRVMQAVRGRIGASQLAPGARLPSIRSLATVLRVSKSTVVEAYERLVADGTVKARPGSGFYVAGQAPTLTLATLAPRLDRAIDPLWVSRQALEAGEQVLKPGCGWLPASWLPEAMLRRALRSQARAAPELLADYGAPQGLPALRLLLSRRLAERGVEAPAERIVLTESGTHAIDLVLRFLVRPGDRVLVDDPCYFNFQAMLRAHRAEVTSVPYGPNGPDLERFAQVLAAERPRLYITNATLHNPTGAVLQPAIAHRLLKLAEQHDLVIVEDDIFAEFQVEPSARLAAFDGLDRVVYLGSFSKTLSAAMRCGFIAVRGDWIEPLVDLRIATAFGGGQLNAAIVLELLRDGAYRRHLDGLRTRLADAMGVTSHRLAALGIRPLVEPRGGMFLWCALPDGLDAARVAREALRHDVVLAPGDVFSLTRTAGSCMRFNVAQSTDPRVMTVLEQAMAAAVRQVA